MKTKSGLSLLSEFLLVAGGLLLAGFLSVTLYEGQESQAPGPQSPRIKALGDDLARQGLTPAQVQTAQDLVTQMEAKDLANARLARATLSILLSGMVLMLGGGVGLWSKHRQLVERVEELAKRV